MFLKNLFKKRGFHLAGFLVGYNKTLDEIEETAARGDLQEAANTTLALGLAVKEISQTWVMSDEDRARLMELRVLCSEQYRELQNNAFQKYLNDKLQDN
jgi:hypothetical protein